MDDKRESVQAMTLADVLYVSSTDSNTLRSAFSTRRLRPFHTFMVRSHLTLARPQVAANAAHAPTSEASRTRSVQNSAPSRDDRLAFFESRASFDGDAADASKSLALLRDIVVL